MTTSAAHYTTHPDYLAFLTAILTHPADDNARLVLADWLEEKGERDRGGFVRVQCELSAHTIGWKPENLSCVDMFLDPQDDNDQAWKHKFWDIQKRESKLLDGLAPAIVGGLPELSRNWSICRDAKPTRVGAAPAPFFALSRGFVSHITLSPADWFAHHESLYWSPEQTVACTWCQGHVTYLPAGREYGGPVSPFETCRACNKGRIPRPVPPTAQPLLTVRFTESQPLLTNNEARALLRNQWPRIRFLLPGDED